LQIVLSYPLYQVLNYFCYFHLYDLNSHSLYSKGTINEWRNGQTSIPVDIPSIISPTTAFYTDLPAGGPYYIEVRSGYGYENNASYTISISDMSPISETKITAPSATYRGSPVVVEPTVTYYDKVLIKGVDYNVTGYANNSKPGTGTAKIVGIGGFYGEKTFSYRIDPMNGWYKQSDGTYKYYSSGIALTGWQKIGGQTYRFGVASGAWVA
jgi:hypothetical protein